MVQRHQFDRKYSHIFCLLLFLLVTTLDFQMGTHTNFTYTRMHARTHTQAKTRHRTDFSSKYLPIYNNKYLSNPFCTMLHHTSKLIFEENKNFVSLFQCLLFVVISFEANISFLFSKNFVGGVFFLLQIFVAAGKKD